MPPLNSNELPHSRRTLVALMSSMGFGHIDDLRLEAGEPVLAPLPAITREIKFGAESSTAPPARPERFSLKPQVVELFDHLDRIGTGVIERLEVRHGLPFRMTVSERASA